MNEPRPDKLGAGTACLTHLDLFSGIGGFTVGFQNSGFRTIAFAEIDAHASLVLRDQWPDIPNVGDVTKLCRRVYDCHYDPETEDAYCPRCQTEFGECDCIGTDQFLDTYGWPYVITGGVPCQPASALGHMRGAADERWLWPEAIRVVSELRPRYALFENPPSVIVLPDFHRVLSDFTTLGYDLLWHVIPASALGAGHPRERLLLLAADSDHPRLERHARHGARSGGTRGCDTWARRPITTPDFRGRVAPGGWWHEAHTGIPVLAHGLSHRLVKSACRCAGNAIVPELAQIFAEALAQ